MFHGETDFDPSAGSFMRTSAGDADAFVLKLMPTGNLAWAETFGGTGVDAALGLAVDSMNVIHLAGYYGGTVDFDPDPLGTYFLTTPSSVNRAFRLRLRQG